MFLNKLRLLTPICQKNYALNETLRQCKVNLPTVSQSVRLYARYIDDDDDDFPVGRRLNSQQNRPNAFRSENEFGARKPFSGNRYQNFNNNNNRPQYNDGGFRKFDNNFIKNRFAQRDVTFNQGITQLKPVNWSQYELSELKKDFYEPSETTKNRSKEEIAEYCAKHEITVPKSAPKPVLTFEELNLPERLTKEIEKQNFAECTPIQAQGWPIALSGKNMVGVAQTG